MDPLPTIARTYTDENAVSTDKNAPMTEATSPAEVSGDSDIPFAVATNSETNEPSSGDSEHLNALAEQPIDSVEQHSASAEVTECTKRTGQQCDRRFEGYFTFR